LQINQHSLHQDFKFTKIQPIKPIIWNNQTEHTKEIHKLQRCREAQFSYFRGTVKREKEKGNIIVDESQTEKTLKIASETMLPLLQSKAVREKQFVAFETMLLPIVG
jgi:hypothetical protein